MIRDMGIVKPGTTLVIPFHAFDSNDPSASTTISGLATTDIEVYKGTSMTQRASDSGYALVDTDGIDIDGTTGINAISIDLADNTTAGFWEAGQQYTVVIASITVDAATVNFIPVTFRIGQPAAVLNTSIATLSSQTSFTLTAGPAEDDALNGMWAIIHDVASSVQWAIVQISDYTGSTKTVTLAAGATFTVAATDNISVMGPMPLQPSTTGRQIGIEASNGKVSGVVLVDTTTDLTNLPTITAGWLTATGIASDAITAAKIATGAITSAKFAAGAIDAAAIATGAIDADAIADNAIDAGAIASGAITNSKFASGAITADTIADAAIDAATFAAGAITATVIATGAIDADAIADGAIDSAAFAAGAITAAVIATDAIDSDAIAGSAVTEMQSGLATAAALATAQTSIDDLPTNAELATSQAAADDVTLAAIAALNNVSAAQVQTAAAAALTAYDPPTRAEATSDKSEILTAIDDIEGGGGGGLSFSDEVPDPGTAGTVGRAFRHVLDNVDAPISGIGGSTGSGADNVTVTVTVDLSPLADADVWVTSDSAGNTVVAGTLQTNSMGQATFLLDAGSTYYLWAQRDGVNAIKGDRFVAAAD